MDLREGKVNKKQAKHIRAGQTVKTGGTRGKGGSSKQDKKRNTK